MSEKYKLNAVEVQMANKILKLNPNAFIKSDDFKKLGISGY